jgi:hypothetical protein
MLMQLRAQPVPPDFAAFGAAVLAGVRERKQLGSLSRKAMAACGALALGAGLSSGVMANGAATVQKPILSLSGADLLAPSALLEDLQ